MENKSMVNAILQKAKKKGISPKTKASIMGTIIPSIAGGMPEDSLAGHLARQAISPKKKKVRAYPVDEKGNRIISSPKKKKPKALPPGPDDTIQKYSEGWEHDQPERINKKIKVIQKSGDMMEAYMKASPAKREEMKKDDKAADENGKKMWKEYVKNAGILQKADIRDILQKAREDIPRDPEDHSEFGPYRSKADQIEAMKQQDIADSLARERNAPPSTKKIRNFKDVPKAGGRYMFSSKVQKEEDLGAKSDADHAKQYPKPAKEWEAMKKKYKNFDVVLAKRTQFNEPKSGQGLEIDMGKERDRVRLGAMEDTIAESGPKVMKKYAKNFRDLIRHWVMEWDSLDMLDGGQQKGKPKINDLVWKGRDKLGPGGKDEYDVPRTAKEMKTERPGLLIKENINLNFKGIKKKDRAKLPDVDEVNNYDPNDSKSKQQMSDKTDAYLEDNKIVGTKSEEESRYKMNPSALGEMKKKLKGTSGKIKLPKTRVHNKPLMGPNPNPDSMNFKINKENIIPRFIDNTKPPEQMTFKVKNKNPKSRTPSWGKFKGINLDNVDNKE